MIYSIGHGNRSWSEFLFILSSKECRFLVDVRSFPKSKFNSSFNDSELKKLCQASGIKYVFMGNLLGGRPKDRSLYDHLGRADYPSFEASKSYQEGIDRLVNASRIKENTFIMCSEKNPAECHRSKLIGKTLKEKGVEVLHIDEEGFEITQLQAIDRITKGQADLFGDDPKATMSRGKYVK